MPRPFIRWPDPRLKAIAEPVSGVDEATHTIWSEMLEAMYAMPGVGLAAPQLGIGLRLAVVDCGHERAAFRLANPEIIATSPDIQKFTEGSPNIPGIEAEVMRPAEVTVRFLDVTGAEVEKSFEGLWATSVQHQIDHLNGKVFLDRLSPMRRQRLVERYRKAEKKARRQGERG